MKKLAECDKEDARLCDTLRALCAKKAELQLACDRCTQEIAKAQAAERLAHSEKTFCLDGWVPAEAAGKLEALLQKHCCAWELTRPRAGGISRRAGQAQKQQADGSFEHGHGDVFAPGL